MLEPIKLIHIECGRYDGIIRYLIRDKILTLRLGTLNYNDDYGEYRVEFEDTIIDKKDYRFDIPDPHLYELEMKSDTRLNMVHPLAPHLPPELYQEYMDEYSSGGRTKIGRKKVFVVRDKFGKIVEYDEWQSRPDHDWYESLMLPSVKLFYEFYNGRLKISKYQPTLSGLSLFDNGGK